MIYAIKTEITEPKEKTFTFLKQKTMCGGKEISVGDTIFIFDSENEGGAGLIAVGVVISAITIPKKRGVARQTPRVSLTVERKKIAKLPLGRDDLKSFQNWDDGHPQTELNFKFYRQATNKIVGLSDKAATFLKKYF